MIVTKLIFVLQKGVHDYLIYDIKARGYFFNYCGVSS